MVSGVEFDRSRIGWWALGAALGAIVLFALYSFLGTVVFAVFIYYATRPVYRRLRRRVSRPSVAAATALFVLALPALLLLAYVVAIGLQELDNVARTVNLGPIGEVLGPYVDVSELARDPGTLLAETGGTDAIQGMVNSALNYIGFIGTALVHLFVMFALAFYLLRDGPRLSRWAIRRFGDDEGVFDAYAAAVDRDLSTVFFGNILNAILTGTIGAIAYSLLNFAAAGELAVPSPALLGLLAGVASLVPVVGMKLVYVPVTIYLGARALLAGGAGLGFVVLFFGVSFVVVDTLPDLVLRPYVSGGSRIRLDLSNRLPRVRRDSSGRGLHVGLVMFAYIFGPLLFGWYGIFLGPLLLVLVVHFARLVLPELMGGEPIRPYAVDPSYLTEPGTPPPDAEPAEATDGGVGRDG